MNVKIDRDHLDGAKPLQDSAALSGSRRAYGATLGPASHDSAVLSNLSVKVADAVAAEQSRIEQRVTHLASLYSRGEYKPDARSLSKSLIDRALSGTQGVQL
jgi:hypothetical protein